MLPKTKPKFDISVEPLLVSVEVAAKMCSLSKRYWLQLDDQGRIPQPIHIGKRKLWKVSDLQKWVSMGCPSRQEFENDKT